MLHNSSNIINFVVYTNEPTIETNVISIAQYLAKQNAQREVILHELLAECPEKTNLSQPTDFFRGEGGCSGRKKSSNLRPQQKQGEQHEYLKTMLYTISKISRCQCLY
jgi:hypothetical protein